MYVLTKTTESLAVIAKISAQDTTPGHTFSTAVLIRSMTSKPLRELLFGLAVFSPLKVGVSSNNTDASQPYHTKTKVRALKIDYRFIVPLNLSYMRREEKKA